MTLERYFQLKRQIIDLGYADDIDWSEALKPVSDSFVYWREFAFVLLNSGMKATVAQGIWDKVYPTVTQGGSAHSVFGHKGKADAIDRIWIERDDRFAAYRTAADKLEHLQGLPWIGPITCYHLAKNLGHDCAKPDRHLVRVAGEEGTHAMCARLSCECGDRIATVDVVIWRAAERGLI